MPPQLSFDDLPNYTFGPDYKLIFSQTASVRAICTLGKSKPGVAVLTGDMKITFVTENDLDVLCSDERTQPRFEPILAILRKVKAVTDWPYNPATDAIIFFEAPSEVFEQLTNKSKAEVRAWWLRPGSKSVKQINLDEDERTIKGLAFAK